MFSETFSKKMTIACAVLVLLSSGFSPLLAGESSDRTNLEDQSSAGSPSVTIIEQTSDHLILEWRLNRYNLDEIIVEKDSYQFLQIDDQPLTSFSEAGEPFVPSLSEIIHIPSGYNASASVIDAVWTQVAEVNLYPRQLPRRDDGSKPGPFIKSEAAYSLAGPFPAENVKVSNVQGWGGMAVASISVVPFRYFPASRQLEVAETVTVRVDFLPGMARRIAKPGRIDPEIIRYQRSILLNPPPIDRQIDADENEPARMLVVVKEEALETTQPLIDFHNLTGIRTEVWLADDIENEFEIKERVLEMYEEEGAGLKYLFIVGDGYENDPDIPMHFWDAEDPGWQDPQSTASHSDTWYICLDEPDEDDFEDHLPELAVGRLVYDNPDELDQLEIQVDKLIDYLEWSFENRDVEWISRAILMGHRENDNDEGGRHYINTKRFIEEFDYSEPAPEFISFYGTDQDVTNQTVINYINETGCGIFNYRGHGNNLTWSRWNGRGQSWDASEVRQLNNRQMPFLLVSSACLNGNIATYRSDCLLEAFQKQDGGSFSAHGSVISSYTRGNHFYDRRLFLQFFDEGVYDVGYANINAITETVLRWENDYFSCIGRMNARTFIWFGDPALEIKISAPDEITVEIPDVLRLGAESVEAVVTQGNEPFSGARLCLQNEDEEIYLVGYSDEDGNILVEFEEPINEAMQLTWTVYHRTAVTESGEIFALDEVGNIEGRVTIRRNGEPIEGAQLSLSRFGVIVNSDVEGRYRIEDVPAIGYTLTASAEGYLSEELELTVDEDRTYAADFALSYSQIAGDSLEVNLYLEELNGSAERRLDFTNAGDGTLEWSATLDFLEERFELLDELDAQEITSDRRLNGVVLIDSVFYVAGGNGSADPNFIYKIGYDGRLIERFEQPEQSAGFGFRDLAWDGEFLYGSSDSSIFMIDLEGQVRGQFTGPYSPNIALTVDSEGNLWVGAGTQPLIKIDIEGNVLQTVYNNYDCRALAWWENAEDGYNLLMLIREDGQNSAKLLGVNPDNGEKRLEIDLAAEEEIMAADGLSISDSYMPGGMALVGMINKAGEKQINLWHLQSYTGWVDLGDELGTVEPDQEFTIALSFTAAEFLDELRLEAELVIESNSLEPVIVIPVVLEVGNINEVASEPLVTMPTGFTVGHAFPNPFNPVTSIRVTIPNRGEMKAAIYDLSGRLVRTLFSGDLNAGNHDIVITAESMTSGVYFIRFDYAGQNSVQKLVLMR